MTMKVWRKNLKMWGCCLCFEAILFPLALVCHIKTLSFPGLHTRTQCWSVLFQVQRYVQLPVFILPNPADGNSVSSPDRRSTVSQPKTLTQLQTVLKVATSWNCSSFDENTLKPKRSLAQTVGRDRKSPVLPSLSSPFVLFFSLLLWLVPAGGAALVWTVLSCFLPVWEWNSDSDDSDVKFWVGVSLVVLSEFILSAFCLFFYLKDVDVKKKHNLNK